MVYNNRSLFNSLDAGKPYISRLLSSLLRHLSSSIKNRLLEIPTNLAKLNDWIFIYSKGTKRLGKHSRAKLAVKSVTKCAAIAAA